MKHFWLFFSLFSPMLSLCGEQTLSIIKPNGVQEHHIGDILSTFEGNGLSVIGIKMLHLTEKQAADFYAVHKERPFFKDLITFMSSGPVVAIVLEGENAVTKNREIMGATDPKKAKVGTIRAAFGKDVTANAVHGSDTPENAKAEISFFFRQNEVFTHP